MTPSRSKLISTALRRGLRKRCPHCGEGRLFSGWSLLDTLFGLRLGLRTQSRGHVGLHHHRRSAATCRDDRPDLFRRGAFASCAGPDACWLCWRRCAIWTTPNRWGVGYRAALPVASVLARSGGSYSAASCDGSASLNPSPALARIQSSRPIFLPPIYNPASVERPTGPTRTACHGRVMATVNRRPRPRSPT